MHGGDESTRRKHNRGVNLHRQRAWTECEDPLRDSQTHRDPEIQGAQPDQVSDRWRIGNVVPAFIDASVLLDAVEIEVDVQKVLQGLPERT
jgi:hypothetical protein